MTARDRIRAKPGPVQVMIKAEMTCLALESLLEDPAPNFERYGELALAWWDREVMAPVLEIDPQASEVAVAEELVEGLRKQEVWGKILRGASE